MISERAKNITASLTLAISAKAKAMKKQGHNVIGFGAGEPDFDTPQNIKNRAKLAIDQGLTKYTPASGLDELKQAAAARIKQDCGLDYTKEEIIIGCGAKHVIFEIIFALINKGDEVLIPSPFWLSYPEMVSLSEGISVFVDTKEENDFKITPHALEQTLRKHPKAKILILNSPSNPTGMVYQRRELEQIAAVLNQYDIFCISDEIYDKLVYDDLANVSIASLSSRMKERTIVVNGVSKTYAMTGWRIGYAYGPKEIIGAAARIQSHTTSNPTSISQIASIEALEGVQNEVAKMREEFASRRDYMVERINRIKGLSVRKPQGAFYCFVSVKSVYGKKMNNKVVKDSLSFSDILLDEEKVAVVPGIVFGNDNYIRLSYASSIENIKEGLDRIEKFIGSLK